MHCQQITQPIKSDEYLKYEAYMEFISINLAGRYKGFQVPNTALNFPKILRHGSHSDLKHPSIIREPKREWQEL
jgi:hypothetical protein